MTGETVTRLRGAAGEGRYGDTAIDWSNPDTLDIEGCAVNPTSGSEDHDDRDAVLADRTVLAPPGVDVLAADRLTVRGETYEVVGDPRQFRNPFDSSMDGDVIPLRRVAG